MNCFTKLSSYTVATLLSRTVHFVANNRSNLSFPIKLQYPLLTRSSYYHHRHYYCYSEFEFDLSRFLGVRCYSTKKGSKSGLKKKKGEEESEAVVMSEKENDAFYVVRKGDIVGIYNSLSDCQAQLGSSVCDPPVSVYKGYSLSKDTEQYLVSHGLKNALYTIRAADLKEDLFDMLLPCPFQEPTSTEGCTSNKDVSKKRSLQVLGHDDVNVTSLTSISEDPLRKQVKLDHAASTEAPLHETRTCLLEFDGASKGNPGKAGAGAILRASDGSLICRLREGVGIATCNAAEYRAMILGMRCALQKGFNDIRIKGDSKLVCMQISGSWKVKNENLSTLYKVAKELKDNFLSFQINHVLRVGIAD
ncbi:hypothetical protein TanjilG_31238 [Lupinus angustifolius]|uniref:RNase H type-1 domain-containing protein n=1 Tax=Lupinus angustifolius TaxID=3871 RepID=A0A1J7HNV9_LUPAN|nr:hypothetical protein TanjilG_31238 [Lupinus angustifolius]